MWTRQRFPQTQRPAGWGTLTGRTIPALLVSLSFVGTGLAAERRHAAKSSGDGSLTGLASWYAEGTKTASGERFDSSSLTAAHRTLPFGTVVQVTNLQSGCSTVVRITDRGPFKKSRIIDVSRAAAKELKMMNSGVARVELVVLH